MAKNGYRGLIFSGEPTSWRVRFTFWIELNTH
jgi:hypothetical protein